MTVGIRWCGPRNMSARRAGCGSSPPVQARPAGRPGWPGHRASRRTPRARLQGLGPGCVLVGWMTCLCVSAEHSVLWGSPGCCTTLRNARFGELLQHISGGVVLVVAAALTRVLAAQVGLCNICCVIMAEFRHSDLRKCTRRLLCPFCTPREKRGSAGITRTPVKRAAKSGYRTIHYDPHHMRLQRLVNLYAQWEVFYYGFRTRHTRTWVVL